MRRVSGLVQSRWDTYMEEVQHGWNEIENEIEYDNGDGVDKVYFAHCRWDKWIEEVLHDWERWAMSTTMETSSTRRTTLSLQAVDFSNCQIRQEQCRLVSGVESCRWQSVANEVPPLLGAPLWDGMVWLSHWISYMFVCSSQDPASILTDAFGSQVPRSHDIRLVTPFFRLIVVVGKSPIGVVFGILWNGRIVRVNVATQNRVAVWISRVAPWRTWLCVVQPIVAIQQPKTSAQSSWACDFLQSIHRWSGGAPRDDHEVVDTMQVLLYGVQLNTDCTLPICDSRMVSCFSTS